MNKASKSTSGILAFLGAAIAYGSMGVLARLLNIDMGVFSQVFLRYLVSFSLSLAFLNFKRIKVAVNKSDWLLLVLIGVFGYGLSNVLITISFINTSISAAVFLISSYPIWTTIMAIVFLKEEFSKRLMVSLGFCLLGAFLLVNPSGFEQSWVGNLAALGGSILTSLYFVGSRKLTKTNPPEVVTTFSILMGVLTVGPLALIFENTFSLNISPFSWFIVLLFGLANFTAWLLVSVGFKVIQAAKGSVLLLMEIVFGILFAVIFYQEWPSLLTITGGVLIVISILYLYWEELKA